jgi:CheY-like chemotaxis protein
LDFLQKSGRYSGAPSPDLVLLDLNLPKRGGDEVLAEIKRDPRTKCTPVIVLTSSKADGNVERVYNLNANCYVQKPSDLDGMLAVLHAIKAFWLEWAVLPSPRGRAGPKADSRLACSELM